MVNRTTQEELDRQALIDDEDLQSALARQRRAKNRQKLEALRQAQTNGCELWQYSFAQVECLLMMFGSH